MATTKKYVSLEKLGLYDEKIKGVISAGDTKALDDAKTYADGLAKNYEPSGAIATAKTELEGKITAAQGAADAAAEAAAKAQGEVDALETLVGTLPEGTEATSVVDYVNKKTAGIATDAALEELNGQVAGLQTAVKAIQDDYLVEADKTELSNAIGAEKTRAEGIEGGLRTDVNAIKADYLKAADKTALQDGIDGVTEDVAAIAEDYLKAADKTELEGKINAKASQTELDGEVTRAKGVEEGLQNQINLIMNNPDTENVINSIEEFTQYVTDHGTIADGFRTDIDQNKKDIAAEVERAGKAEDALSGRLDTLEAINHDAYVAADAALKTELTTEIGKKADASVVSAQGEAIAALQGADTTLSGRIDALEGAVGESGSVAEDIATAKDEAIAAAATDATTKANAAEANAKGYTDSEIDKVEATISTMQTAIDGKAAQSDLTALAGRVTTAEGEIDTLQTEMDAVEALADAADKAAKANAQAIALKAAQADLEAVSGRVTTLENWHKDFVECSQEDINGLFD